MGGRAVYGRVGRYLLAIALILAVAAAFYALSEVLDRTIIALLFLIPVGICAATWGLGPGIAAALSAFLAFNYLFIPPYYTFIVHRLSDLVVLLVFLIVAAVISQLLARARQGMETATAREREATQLYELSTTLAGLHEDRLIVKALAEHLQSAFFYDAVEVQLASDPSSAVRLPEDRGMPPRPGDLVVAIQAPRGPLGEVRVWRKDPPISPAESRLLHTFASQGALALERLALARTEARTRLLEESDLLKTSLLSSVSHELRTPLATIKAAASSLRTGDVAWDSPARADLVAAIDEETDHLNMLVGNLLDMTRIESGALRPQRTWNVLAEIVQSVLDRMHRDVEHHILVVDIPEDLPLVPVDYVEMEQVFTNLVSNSIKFAPVGTTVRISAQAEDDRTVHVQLSNQGPPVPQEDLERIFDKFYRITAADRVTGTGLGLSICKGIIQAHGGDIWAENRPDGFAFNFTLPLTLDHVSGPLEAEEGAAG